MRSIEDHAQALADYLPNGRLFEGKNIGDSNFRQLLRGIAGELFTAQGYIKTLNDEFLPDLTVLFIEEWERALGIPDDCFSGTGTLNERRRDILVKLSALGVQTEDDFVELALVFGKVVTVTPLSEELFPPYDVPFNPSSLPDARFIVVVQGDNLVSGVPPYDVPFDLVVGETVLECLLNKVGIANGNIIFRNN
jgi:uncharacterized protein YmfQ (DUF2313 family)